MKKIIFSVALILSILFVPNLGQAQTVSELQVQIQELLEIIKSLQEKLVNLNGGDQDTGPDLGTLSCLDLKHNLYLGLNDVRSSGEVSKLQQYLKKTGDFTYPEITGYYGSLTQTAVQSWQRKNGVVSSGSPETTGYGVVGPQTREAIKEVTCGSVVPIPPPPYYSPEFKASPASGANPLSVTFSAIPKPGVSYNNYYVSFGDGTQSDLVIKADGRMYASHTYTKAGIYTASLQERYVCSPTADSDCLALYSSGIASVKVTVLEDTSISPSVTVLSPNGGEIWNIGSKQTLKWRVDGVGGGEYLVLELHGPSSMHIKSYAYPISGSGENSLDYLVPASGVIADYGVSLEPGSYKVSATLYDSPPCGGLPRPEDPCVKAKVLASDKSDAFFKINPNYYFKTWKSSVSGNEMTVHFRAFRPSSDNSDKKYYVQFGDGSDAYVFESCPALPTTNTGTDTESCSSPELLVSHTYKSFGTYTAYLGRGILPSESNGSETLLDTVASIKVTVYPDIFPASE